MLLEDYNLKKKLIGVLDVKGCSINIIHALNKTNMSTQIQPERETFREYLRDNLWIEINQRRDMAGMFGNRGVELKVLDKVFELYDKYKSEKIKI